MASSSVWKLICWAMVPLVFLVLAAATTSECRSGSLGNAWTDRSLFDKNGKFVGLALLSNRVRPNQFRRIGRNGNVRRRDTPAYRGPASQLLESLMKSNRGPGRSTIGFMGKRGGDADAASALVSVSDAVTGSSDEDEQYNSISLEQSHNV